MLVAAAQGRDHGDPAVDTTGSAGRAAGEIDVGSIRTEGEVDAWPLAVAHDRIGRRDRGVDDLGQLVAGNGEGIAAHLDIERPGIGQSRVLNRIIAGIDVDVAHRADATGAQQERGGKGGKREKARHDHKLLLGLAGKYGDPLSHILPAADAFRPTEATLSPIQSIGSDGRSPCQIVRRRRKHRRIGPVVRQRGLQESQETQGSQESQRAFPLDPDDAETGRGSAGRRLTLSGDPWSNLRAAPDSAPRPCRGQRRQGLLRHRVRPPR